MVQLIGVVAVDPKEHKIDEDEVVRLVIKVRDRDDDYRPFYTHHVVIAPKLVAKRCSRQGIEQYDELLVKGRLNNFKDKASGKVISNVQAHEILSMSRHKERSAPREMSPEEREAHERSRETAGKYVEMLCDPKYQEAEEKGTVVSLLHKRLDKAMAESDFDDFDYENEDEYNPPF